MITGVFLNFALQAMTMSSSQRNCMVLLSPKVNGDLMASGRVKRDTTLFVLALAGMQTGDRHHLEFEPQCTLGCSAYTQCWHQLM